VEEIAKGISCLGKGTEASGRQQVLAQEDSNDGNDQY